MPPTLLEKWEKEGTSLAQGYIAAKIAEDVLKKLAAERTYSVTPKLKGPIVIDNIEDDTHSLGRKMVMTFMETDGWEVYDMGNDVLADEFVDKAVDIGAKVIGISAMMYTTAKNIEKVRQEIDKRNLTGKIQLAVGGAVFVLRPELVDEVGGDGTARNAMEAPKLFENLWKKACQEEGNE